MVEVLQAYDEVDKVFNQCDKYGKILSRIMGVWARHARGESNLPSAIGSRSGSPAEADAGIHLTEMDEDAFERVQSGNVQADVKDAFKDYIRSAPEGIPESVKLKGYQMLGINWLNLLYSQGLSCILADEMGKLSHANLIAADIWLKVSAKPSKSSLSSRISNRQRDQARISSSFLLLLSTIGYENSIPSPRN